MIGFRHFVQVTLIAALALVLASPAVAAGEANTLYLFSWSQYMNPALITAFEKKYDVKVVQSFYESMPELFAKLRAGGDSQYDVIVPSNYYVPRLIATGLIQPLNKKIVSNYSNIADRFLKPNYDPQGKYTAPYQWGDTGIAYNAAKLKNVPDSWAILFDPKVNSKYPFALATDAQVVLGSACAYQGHGYDCSGRDNWQKAARLVLQSKQRSNFGSFDSGTPVLRQLARGNVVAGMTYNGDFAYYKQRNPETFKHMKFVVPREGAELWVDTMAIPAHAPHPKLANQFINFILDAKNGAALSNYTHYASPNKASQQYLDASLRQPPAQPSAAQMKHLHFTPALKGQDLQFVQQLWTEVQSR